MNSSTGFGKAAKLIHKVDSPYTSTTWPQIPSKEHNVMLEMLCSLLAPLGRHRAAHAVPSEGKRSKKRKRERSKEDEPIIPPPPSIADSLVIGLNSVTRYLEDMSVSSAPAALHSMAQDGNSHKKTLERNVSRVETNRHMAVIFLPKSEQDMRYSHLPLLSVTASLAHKDLPATRLVPLNPAAEKELTATLGLPRVGVVGVMEAAPGAIPLIEYVRQHVHPVDVPWLKEALEGSYLGLNIKTEQSGTSGVRERAKSSHA